MGQLASTGQLRMVLVRRALVTVPLVVLLGLASGALSSFGSADRWYASLVKPPATPPGWLFPVAWTTLYAMQGLALALIWQARGAPGRGAAAAAFFVQLALNLAWSPTFFGAHRIRAAFWLIVAMLAAAIVATLLFGRIRRAAALLMLPYLAWLGFAGTLNHRIDALNPNGGTLAPRPASTQITV